MKLVTKTRLASCILLAWYLAGFAQSGTIDSSSVPKKKAGRYEVEKGIIGGVSKVELSSKTFTKPDPPSFHPGYFPDTVIDGAPKVKQGTPIKNLKLLPDFYQTPKMPFIVNSGEQVVQVSIESCTGKEAQEILNDERKFVPDAVFVVTVDGVITISEQPLAPKKKTCLIFRKGAKIIAAPGCKAKELVLIKDTELISFSSEKGEKAVIDGAGVKVTGIRVENSGKVHLDRLAINNCGEGGLIVKGRGDENYADPVSLTRSKITNCKTDGVKVSQSPEFIALDNIITGNAKAGIEIDSPLAIIANNICAGNNIGLHISTPRSTTITRNQLIANKTGLDINQKSDFALVYENTLQNNGLGVNISGTNTTIAWNIFAANKQQVKSGGKENLLQSNIGLKVKDAGAGVAYFNPPTMANPHKEKLIWKGQKENDVAMERHDLTINSGDKVMDVTQVTETLKSAREANPDKVLVARLKGDFIVKTNDGLIVPDNTCIILDGNVTNAPSAKQRPYMISLKGKGCVSLSGGKITSKTSVYEAVTAQRGKNNALIDGVYINLYANNRKVGSKSLNAVGAKQHKGAFILRGSEINDSGQRAIWAHVSKRIYVLGNRFYGSGMTIDFDAFCYESAALYNTITGVTHHSGIFFEEGVKYNTAFANRLYANKASAIQIWTQSTKLNTERNLIACNDIVGGAKDEFGSGFSVGAHKDNPLKRADNNYIFNNRFDRCNGRAAINMKPGAANNYFGQNIILKNKNDIINWSKGWNKQSQTSDYTLQNGFTSPAP